MNWKGTVRSTARCSRLRALADAEQLLAGGDGGLDRPAVGVAGHDVLDGAVEVGGEDRQDLRVAGVVDQHDAAGLVAERAVPEGGDLDDLDGVAAAVAGHRDPPPAGGGGELGGGAQPVALQPGAAPRLPVRGGGGAYSTALAGSRVVNVAPSVSSASPW